MNARLRRAVAKIHTKGMFSDDAWRQIRKELKGISAESEDRELGDAFVEFIQIWYADNGVETYDDDEEEKVNDLLLDSFTRCLQRLP